MRTRLVKTLDELESDSGFWIQKPTPYKCSRCGNVIYRLPPKVCPVCGDRKSTVVSTWN